jgi:hypothetical protein
MYLKIWILAAVLGVLQAVYVSNLDFHDEANIYFFIGAAIAGTMIVGVPLSVILWVFRIWTNRKRI